MISRSFRRVNRGWTLVELAVVLVISALLATVAVQLLPLGVIMAEEDLAQRRLDQADEALLGYARTYSRLPHADSNGDGRQDAGVSDGFLPYIDLGLPKGKPLPYTVTAQLSKDADSYLYYPSLPVTGAVATRMPSANALDFCVLLGNAQRQLDTTAAGDYQAAYAIAHRLPTEGVPNTPFTTLGTAALSANADTSLLHRAVGVGELHTRLNCSEQLNRAFAAAQAATTAQSALLLSELDAEIAHFYIDVATSEHQLNVASYNLATWNVINATFELAIGTLQAVPDIAPPVNAKKVALAVVSIAKALNGLRSAISDQMEAEQTKDQSEEKINVTRRHADHADEQSARAKALRDAATEKAFQLEQAGLNP